MKNKMKVTALALVASVALIGAGYAAWGNSIVDNTTLKTGQWSVVLENDAIGNSLAAGDEVDFAKKDGSVDSKSVDGYDKYDAVDSSAISGAKKVKGTNYVYTIAPTISSDKQTVSFDFFNMHPGTTAKTRFEVRNMGSIPAKIGDVKVLFNGKTADNLTGSEKDLLDAIVVDGCFFKHHASDAGVALGNISKVPLANLEASLEGVLVKDSIQILPKESVDMNNLDSDELEFGEENDPNGLTFSIPMDKLGGNKAMNTSLKISVQFDFVQYNQLVEE